MFVNQQILQTLHVIALKVRVPKSVPAYTVHRNCASGFESITQAHDKINAVEETFI